MRRRLQGVLGLPLKIGASCTFADSVTSATEHSLPVTMDHPSDAAMHAFWQITELSDAIERRLAARDWQPLQYTGTADQLSKKGRRYILCTAWHRICEVLNGIEDEERLSSHARLLQRVCLGSAKYFVGLVFHHFCRRQATRPIQIQCGGGSMERLRQIRERQHARTPRSIDRPWEREARA